MLDLFKVDDLLFLQRFKSDYVFAKFSEVNFAESSCADHTQESVIADFAVRILNLSSVRGLGLIRCTA